MPKLSRSLAKVVTSRPCAKCGSTEDIARHHTGCEAMWLRHFIAQASTKRYQDFKKRYESFHKDDTVLLCKKCHRLIHEFYFIVISYYASSGGEKLSKWSWKRAEKLMQMLRTYCKIWLSQKPLSEEY
jgi:hypothetical protein